MEQLKGLLSASYAIGFDYFCGGRDGDTTESAVGYWDREPISLNYMLQVGLVYLIGS